jgi:hypothetical protein
VVWVQQVFTIITKMVKEKRGTTFLNLEGKTSLQKPEKATERRGGQDFFCPLKKY